MSMEQLIILAALAVYALVRWLARQRQDAFTRVDEPTTDETVFEPSQHVETTRELDPPQRRHPPRRLDPPQPHVSLPGDVPGAPPRRFGELEGAHSPQALEPLEVLAARREREARLRRVAARRDQAAAERSGAKLRSGRVSTVRPADLRPAELRRAIVLMTILGPPRALDPPHAVPPADARET